MLLTWVQGYSKGEDPEWEVKPPFLTAADQLAWQPAGTAGAPPPEGVEGLGGAHSHPLAPVGAGGPCREGPCYMPEPQYRGQEQH